MSNARKHHYISQFYLKGFSKNGGTKTKLFVYDKVTKKYFTSNPRNIAAERDFNRISIEGKENYIEEHQSKKEAKIASVFRKLTESKEYPNDEDLSHILDFISLVGLRNPKIRAIFDKLYKDIANKLLRGLIVSKESYINQCLKAGFKEEDVIPYEKQKEFIEDGSYDISINQEIHIQAEHENIDYLSELLHKRYWYLVRSNEATGEFITSDYPLSIISNDGHSDIYGVGYGMKKTEVCFPISKDLALVGVYEKYDTDRIIATKDLVKIINRRTYESSSRQAYSTKKLNLDDI